MIQEKQRSLQPDRMRKLLNIERFFLWNPLTMVACIARIRGDLVEQDLRIAIAKVRQVHPLLGSRIIIDDRQDAWFSSDPAHENLIRVVKRESGTQWKDELRAEYRIPFAHETGPLIRFVLLHSSEESELLIIASHTICDGMSVAHLIRDILAFYADPEAPVRRIDPPVLTDFLSIPGGFSLRILMGRFFIKQINTKWLKRPYFFTQEDYKAIHQACSKNLTPDFLCIEFDERETETLLRRCRKNNVSMGSAVTAACIAAYHDIIGPLPKRSRSVNIPFDLRRHGKYGGSDPFCLFFGGFQFPFQYDPGKPFWDIARDLHGKTGKLLQENQSDPRLLGELFEPSLVDAYGNFAFFQRIFPETFEERESLSLFAKDTANVAYRIFGDYVKKEPGVFQTNLGRLNIPEQYGDLILDRVWFFPTINISIPLVLAGVSVGNRTTWSLPYVREEQYSPVTADNLELIRDCAVAYLVREED